MHPRIGSMRQIASLRRAVLDDGKGRGMRIIDLDNGSGLAFTVYPDRGMDLGEAHYKGIPLVWLSANGPVAPQFYEAQGFNWLRTWSGGLLTGCGLMNVGGPNNCGGEDHGLHGRLSHTPAGEVNTRTDWNGDRYELEVSGKIRVSRVFAKNLLLTRRISTALGDNSITVEDRIENQGFNPCADHEFLRALGFLAGADLRTEVLNGVLRLDHLGAEEAVLLEAGLVLDNDHGNSEAF